MAARPRQLDPLRISERTYKQFGRLLDMLEDKSNAAEITIPQLINALKALQGYDLNAVRKDDDEPAGHAVSAYTRAFEANATRRRKKAARRSAAAVAAVDRDDDDADESD
jgi:hypothetical protein